MQRDQSKRLESEPSRTPVSRKQDIVSATGDVVQDIERACKEIQDLLVNKNRKYGNSALEPLRLFSGADATEQLLVRIDDKLSRIQNIGLSYPGDEDTLDDLIGYLILLKISRAER